MTFICRLFRKKKKETPKLVEADFSSVLNSELIFIANEDDYRQHHLLDYLDWNGYLQTLANQRTKFWNDNGYDHDDNLHEFFPAHAEPYKKKFTAIVELANYGIMGDFDSFRNSPKHNPHLLGDYKYIAVSMLDKYCCVILSK